MKSGLLVADADPKLRCEYHGLSLTWGFPIETAANGVECWGKLKADPPDALVVDADLPWGGGEGVVACLRESTAGAPAPEIFVTGSATPTALANRFNLPLENCFQKPFWLSTLLETVAAAIGPSRQHEMLLEEILAVPVARVNPALEMRNPPPRTAEPRTVSPDPIAIP